APVRKHHFGSFRQFQMTHPGQTIHPPHTPSPAAAPRRRPLPAGEVGELHHSSFLPLHSTFALRHSPSPPHSTFARRHSPFPPHSTFALRHSTFPRPSTFSETAHSAPSRAA